MNTFDFITLLSEDIHEPLQKIGFNNVGHGVYARFKDSHEINVISIQPHSTKPQVCLNFGVHYDFLPTLGSTDLPELESIDLADCEIKVRITPIESEGDHWWALNSAAMGEIASLIRQRATQFFERYDIDGEIADVTPESISDGVPDIFSGITKVRLCLILARLHELNRAYEKTKCFAELGIKIAGMAVGPKKTLKEILKRIE